MGLGLGEPCLTWARGSAAAPPSHLCPQARSSGDTAKRGHPQAPAGRWGVVARWGDSSAPRWRGHVCVSGVRGSTHVPAHEHPDSLPSDHPEGDRQQSRAQVRKSGPWEPAGPASQLRREHPGFLGPRAEQAGLRSAVLAAPLLGVLCTAPNRRELLFTVLCVSLRVSICQGLVGPSICEGRDALGGQEEPRVGVGANPAKTEGLTPGMGETLPEFVL